MKTSNFIAAVLFSSFILPTIAHATTIAYDGSGTVWQTNGIVKVGTYGADMAGMQVTVNFSDGSKETREWSENSDSLFGAWGSSWNLTVNSGSTYYNSRHFEPWSLTVNKDASITGFFIDAGTGNSVFDGTRTYASDPITYPSTHNSQTGSPFAYHNMLDPTGLTLATYSGLVALTGQAPVGDLYRYLSIDFGGIVSGNTLQFSADTDNITSSLTPVPEPATALLFAAGAAGMAAINRRKRK